MMTSYTIRRCGLDDAATIARHRVEMFREMGDVPNDGLAHDLLQRSTSALAILLADGSYLGWFALDTVGSVIGGAGVHIKPQLPRVSQNNARIEDSPVPLVVNVYTEPQWRGKGVAKSLLRELMQWASQQGMDRVVLHASDAGRPLYEKLGFRSTNEMRWFVPGR